MSITSMILDSYQSFNECGVAFGNNNKTSFVVINNRNFCNARREDIALVHRHVAAAALGLARGSGKRVRMLPTEIRYCCAFVPMLEGWIVCQNAEMLMLQLSCIDQETPSLSFEELCIRFFQAMYKKAFGLDHYFDAYRAYKSHFATAPNFILFTFLRHPNKYGHVLRTGRCKMHPSWDQAIVSICSDELLRAKQDGRDLSIVAKCPGCGEDCSFCACDDCSSPEVEKQAAKKFQSFGLTKLKTPKKLIVSSVSNATRAKDQTKRRSINAWSKNSRRLFD